MYEIVILVIALAALMFVAGLVLLDMCVAATEELEKDLKKCG